MLKVSMFGSVYFGQAYFGGYEQAVVQAVRNLFLLLDFTLAPVAVDFAKAGEKTLTFQNGALDVAYEPGELNLVYHTIMETLELT